MSGCDYEGVIEVLVADLDSVTLIGPPVAARSTFKPALKGAREARRVLVSDGIGDFLDAHIAGCKQVRRPLHSLLMEHMTKGKARGLFEQVTKIGIAEMKSPGPVIDGASRVVFHHLQELAETPILNRGWRTEGIHSSLRKGSGVREIRAVCSYRTGCDSMVARTTRRHSRVELGQPPDRTNLT